MSRLSRLRVEDILTILVVVAFLLLGARVEGSPEDRRWEYSFVVFPAALLILGASLRYAVGRAGGIGETLRRIGAVIRDWLPFALFLIFYETLRSRLWNSMTIHERDGALLRIDRALFGETPSVGMQSWISPQVTELFAFCYFAHLLLPPFLAFLWYRRDVEVFRRFLLSVFLCGAIGFACYLAVPAVGPLAAFPNLYSIPLSGTTAMEAVTMMDAARAPHDVFPSLHIAISAITLFFAWGYGRKTFWLLVPLVVGNWISTIYLRYHYMIDVVAGFVCAAIAIVLADLLLRVERRLRGAVPAEASA